MEDIVIQSQLLQFGDSHLLVELRMLNSDKTEIKAIMWSTFVHFKLLQQKREKHSEEFMELFKQVVKPVTELSFEERVSAVKKQKVVTIYRFARLFSVGTFKQIDYENSNK